MTAEDLRGRLQRLATKRGWDFQTAPGAGSHLKVRLNGRRTVIPMHGGDLKTGTFKKVMDDLGLSGADLEV